MITHLRAAIGLSNLTPEAKVTQSQMIHDAMDGNSNFPANELPVPLANAQAAINNLQSAIVAANAVDGTSADIGYMHEQERLLIGIFSLLRSYVEYKANLTTDPATIIVSAGMAAATSGGQNAVSELTLDAVGNGKVVVRIPRGEGEKAFIFETSPDGISWTWAASSTLTKITLSGLTPVSTLYVRYYGISKNGNSERSQPRSVTVI